MLALARPSINCEELTGDRGRREKMRNEIHMVFLKATERTPPPYPHTHPQNAAGRLPASELNVS